MMSWEDKVMEYINKHPGATDREMSQYFKTRNQTINGTAHSLERKGLLIRNENPEKGGLISNYPTGQEYEKKAFVTESASTDEALQEEDIKHLITDKLIADGWDVKTAWGTTRGVDIDARRGNSRWMMEIKGPGSLNPMRNNYFVSILGEMLQGMDDPTARYTIVLPDIDKYRRLWSELPRLAKDRTKIDIIFVAKDGTIENLK